MGGDVVRAKAQTLNAVVHDEAITRANCVAAELVQRLAADSNGSDGAAAIELAFDMRYVGQEHSITVEVPTRVGTIAIDSDALVRRFTDQYRLTFGVTLAEETELTTVRVTSRNRLTARHTQTVSAAAHPGRRSVQRAFSFARDKMMDFTLCDFDDLTVGDALVGPAVISGETQTVYVDADFVARLSDAGALLLDYEPERGADAPSSGASGARGN